VTTGIPTLFEGVNFRSRLEARWAAMFTLLGWRWTYEPIDLAGYIPDFVLHFATPLLVEVKPALSISELRDEAIALDARVDLDRPMLLVGAHPNALTAKTDLGCTGLLREPVAVMRAFETPHAGSISEGKWMESFVWKAAAGNRRVGTFSLGQRFSAMMLSALDEFWREAGNQVQWRPRR